MRQNSVLYFGCLVRVLSSARPCANWHFSPYLQVPFSSYGLHSSVLYLDEFCDCDCCWLLLLLLLPPLLRWKPSCGCDELAEEAEDVEDDDEGDKLR